MGYDVAGHETVLVALVSAIAESENKDPTDVPMVADTINPDALNQLQNNTDCCTATLTIEVSESVATIEFEDEIEIEVRPKHPEHPNV